jgi:hypothetical protein
MTGIPVVYIRFMLEMAGPVLLFFIFLLKNKRLYQNNKMYRKIGLTSSFLVIWILFMPSLFKSMIGLVDCRRIGSKYYIQKDLTQECFTNDYIFYTTILILPSFLIFVVVVPLALVYFIHKGRAKQQKSVIKRYQYYYIDAEFKKRLIFMNMPGSSIGNWFEWLKSCLSWSVMKP